MTEGTLEYSCIRDYSPAAKLKWLVVAAALVGMAGMASYLTDFVIYFWPGAFRGVGTSMGHRGQTDYLSMTLNIGGMILDAWLAIAAVVFLMGYSARRWLVLAAWVLVFAHAVATVYLQFRYRQRSPIPDRFIEAIWDVRSFITDNLPCALIIIFFGQRGTPLTLAELSAPVVSSAEAGPPGRKLENRPPSPR